ncbi:MULTISPECIES: divergent polysaccharide deacetylase family protein [unclassified Gilliamella]|uniref:divergent polysaccharide deacetylase family protein n=1 Tax=unclassified Gilliamella TaxID=2685620 RepID=UPI001307CFAE|nr:MULTISPECIES: divergent polysaccharide deacetylase family protein [unclassified Gilliamella]MWP50306.1 divergent polysaccharide deacetylase family protein [Gilliamella sp. Lep-s35]MWP70020.1 divergent polysaccharide deacetylase family protein [Gilliamella sp. Lep-s5]MWP78257.1 divergent polysaccharide deacetylase family protein [Gilliamella sp. Lep-s21]
MVKIVRYFIAIFIASLLLLNTHCVWAAKLAIVIDDFGYHQHNEEQIISFSPNITVAVLPNSPNAKRIANKAREHGNDILIHLPMAPLGKQPLEKDTLFPFMNEAQVNQIVTNAIELVPHAVGVNNHMGSLMTANLTGMKHVMKTLSNYSLFFLDSKTIGKTQIKKAASYYNIPVLTRDVFLDSQQQESAISQQFDLAVKLARKNGVAIVIGHPYPQTINVLKQKLANLPEDIKLAKISQLITTMPTPVLHKTMLKDIFEKYKKNFYKLSNIKIEDE